MKILALGSPSRAGTASAVIGSIAHASPRASGRTGSSRVVNTIGIIASAALAARTEAVAGEGRQAPLRVRSEQLARDRDLAIDGAGRGAARNGQSHAASNHGMKLRCLAENGLIEPS